MFTFLDIKNRRFFISKKVISDFLKCNRGYTSALVADFDQAFQLVQQGQQGVGLVEGYQLIGDLVQGLGA